MLSKAGSWNDLIPLIVNENIQHISFDFWNTIVRPNRLFKEKRAELVGIFLNNQFSQYEIDSAFSKIGNKYNEHQQAGNPVISPLDLLRSVLNEIKPDSNIDLIELQKQLNILFLQYPPHIEPSFYDIIDLVNNKDKTCSITSNTAFISGSVIDKYLKKSNLLHRFSFTIFSDEFGFGKPSSKIFDHLTIKAMECKSTVVRRNILHIGDDVESDYKGAIQSSLTAFHLLDNNLLKNRRYALHAINDINDIPFSSEEYSKFKFGSYSLAKKFGRDLFEYFKVFHFDKLVHGHRNIIVYSSPYMQIPTSSYYLTETFYKALKQYLESKRTTTIKIEFGKIERFQTYTEDYGALTAEERFNLIKNDTYKLITIPKKDDLCIFIDDISITGTHQRVVEHLLDSSGIETSSFFLYFAKLDDSTACPSFENFLNYSFVDDFDKLVEIITFDDYRITTRTTKYILGAKIEDVNKLMSIFIQKGKFEVWNELILLSYANGYNEIKLYQDNISRLGSGFRKLKISERTNKKKNETWSI
jgi:FMN phosphatase YigB (HAD superfamily)